MTAYLSLYRKYRPQRFSDLVGQEHITRILQNALDSGRVAHAYLFCGPRGTGKTTTARLLAKALNCANGPAREPCAVCAACQRIAGGSSLDVIEIDAASNRGIDDIRELRDKVKYAPAEVRYKVYVVDECHMLTPEAFNALLKTLEEPPPHVLFILATTDPQKVPPTILSRCQRLDFRRGTVADIVACLKNVVAKENLAVEEEALVLIARSADGSWRDALSILEQVIAFGTLPNSPSNGKLTAEAVRTILGSVRSDLLFECAEALLTQDATRALQLVTYLANEGKDIRDFLRGLVAHFRNLLLVSASGGRVLPDGATQEEIRVLSEQARRFPSASYLRILGVLSEAEKEMQRDSQHRLLLEVAFLRLMSQSVPRVEAELESQVTARELRPVTTEPREGLEPPAAHRQVATPSSAPVPQAEGTAIQQESEPEEAPRSAMGRTGDLESEWPLIVEQVKSVRLRAILREVRPALSRDGGILLLVREGYQFHRDQLEKPENLRLVKEAICQVLGTDVTVQVEMEGASDDTTGASAASVRAVPTQALEGTGKPVGSVANEPDPYDANTMSVKNVLDLFEGRILQGQDAP